MDSMSGMSMGTMATTTASVATTAASMAMGSMTMSMSPTSTAASSSSGGSMSGMDMGHSCKISMLWNWNTVDSCFISKSWHITSHGMFGGSCIGVICLVISLEFLRRVGREYDAFIVRRARLRRQYLSSMPSLSSPLTSSATPFGTSGVPGAEIENASHCSNHEAHAAPKTDARSAAAGYDPAQNASMDPVRPTIVEQFIRATLHMVQFAVAYFVMLLAMYFNGYIIICIFIGAWLGAFIFSWEPLGPGKEIDVTQVTKCCG
ncbi:hypothetical protein MAP00_009047 [Monascus purpureus]|nr:hypothetical protein MAP00_009047 [Monascus purpureus]